MKALLLPSSCHTSHFQFLWSYPHHWISWIQLQGPFITSCWFEPSLSVGMSVLHTIFPIDPLEIWLQLPFFSRPKMLPHLINRLMLSFLIHYKVEKKKTCRYLYSFWIIQNQLLFRENLKLRSYLTYNKLRNVT